MDTLSSNSASSNMMTLNQLKKEKSLIKKKIEDDFIEDFNKEFEIALKIESEDSKSKSKTSKDTKVKEEKVFSDKELGKKGFISCLNKNKNIKKLTFIDCGFNLEGLNITLKPKIMKNKLENLYISKAVISNGFEYLLEHNAFNNLKRLTLVECNLKNIETLRLVNTFCIGLVNGRKLEKFEIKNCSLRDEDLSALSLVIDCTDEFILESGNKKRFSLINTLLRCQKFCNNLKISNINLIIDKIVAPLSLFPNQIKYLEKLNLENCFITNKTLPIIIAFSLNPKTLKPQTMNSSLKQHKRNILIKLCK